MRLVVDRQGSDPRAARGSSTSASRPPVSRSASCARRSRGARGGLLGDRGATRWNVRALGHIDHRKVVVVDGRIGWVGGAGIEDHFEDGRFHDLFIRVTGPVVAQLQLVFLAGFRWLGGPVPAAELDALFPAPEEAAADTGRRPPQRPWSVPADHRRDRARCSRRDARRSTSSIPTSPTAG